MAALSLTAAKISADQTQGAIIRNYEAAATLTVGALVSLNASNKLTLADADQAAAVIRAVGIVVNSADMYGSTSIASGQRCSVCVFGPVWGFASLTPGAPGYVSDTAGEISDAAGTKNLLVGRAVAADTFFVNIGVAEYV